MLETIRKLKQTRILKLDITKPVNINYKLIEYLVNHEKSN